MQDENIAITKASGNSDQKRIAGIGEYKNQIGELVEGFKKGEIGAGGLAKGAASAGKQMFISFVTNPIVIAIGAIVAVFATLKEAFSRNEEASNKLKQVTGALSGVFGGFMNALKPVVNFIADNVIKAFDTLGNVAEKASGLVSKGLRALGFDKAAEGVDKMTASVKENAKAGQELARMQAEQTKNERELNRIRFEYLKEQEKFRQIRDDVSKSTAERIKANDNLGASLLKQSKVEREILDQALVIAQERVKIDGETAENLDKVAEAKANIADLEERINGFQSEQLVNAVGIRKEATELAKAQDQLTTEAQRRLKDAEIAAMVEGEAKQVAISEEAFKRSIEDLKTNGQYTAELEANLQKAHQMDLQKIRDDFAQQKKDKDNADLETSIANFEKNMQKEAEILSNGYKDQEQELKRQYSKGRLSKKEYEDQLLQLQVNSSKEANDKTILALQEELKIANLSTDKQAEISNKLRDLQIANENSVLDATISANESKIESDKARLDNVLAVTEQITNAGMELFGAIAEFDKRQSESRTAALEEEQAKSDEYFSSRQTNLDNAIMSDERREAEQKKITEEKAKRDEAIAKKLRDEKIRQAKWEKAQSIISASISTALATIKALVDPGGILGAVYAVLAATTGAVTIATIASQQIPAYEHGGVTKGGLALWGEKQTEVAEFQSGRILFSEKPEVRHFDAGVKIHESVQSFYQKKANEENRGGFEFDYKKMAELMPSRDIIHNENNTWTEIKKNGARVTSIERRYKLGN